MLASPEGASSKAFDVQNRNLSLAKVRECAGAGQHFLAPGNIGLARRAGGGNLSLDQVLFERGEHAAGLFDFLEQRPCRLAKSLRQAFDAAGARGGIGRLRQIGFFQQNKLRIAGDAPRKRIRQSERQGMGQHRDRVGPGKASRKRRHRGPQHVHVRVALGLHPPRRFGGHEGRFWRKATGGFNSSPQHTQRAEFRHRQELVGVGGPALNEIAARAASRSMPSEFQHAQIGDSQRQRERQLLGFRPARVMDRTSIGQHKRTAKTPLISPRTTPANGFSISFHAAGATPRAATVLSA